MSEAIGGPPTARDLAESNRGEGGRFESSTRRALAVHSPLLGLPLEEQPPLFVEALLAVEAGAKKRKRGRRRAGLDV